MRLLERPALPEEERGGDDERTAPLPDLLRDDGMLRTDPPLGVDRGDVYEGDGRVLGCERVVRGGV